MVYLGFFSFSFLIKGLYPASLGEPVFNRHVKDPEHMPVKKQKTKKTFNEVCNIVRLFNKSFIFYPVLRISAPQMKPLNKPSFDILKKKYQVSISNLIAW